jgi:hypothetical protein
MTDGMSGMEVGTGIAASDEEKRQATVRSSARKLAAKVADRNSQPLRA